jgi:hypothetical protein
VSARVGESTSRYGPLFWAGLAVGGAMMAFGAWTAVRFWGATKPPVLVGYLVGLTLLHDLVLVPIVLAVATLLLRRSPRVARGIAAGAVAASAVVIAVAFLIVTRWGALPDNPSQLPRNGVFGLVVSLAVVWLVAGLLLWRSARRRRAA